MNSKTDALRIDFAGLDLKNPFLLASASPTRNAEMIARAFDAGWGGAVIKTIYESRLDREPRPMLSNIKYGRRNIGMANLSVSPPLGLDEWQRQIPGLKAEYPDHAVIGSIASRHFEAEDWRTLARGIASSGVDALELDLSCTHNPDIRVDGRLPGEVVTVTRDIITWVRDAVKIPLIAKLPGAIPNIALLVKECKNAGANAVSGINTIPCIPGVDLDTFSPFPILKGGSAYSGLSGPAIKPIALRAVAEMARASVLPISGIGGITVWQDVAEFMLLGARTIQVCTAVMWNGYMIVEDLVSGLSQYLDNKGLHQVSDLVGLANTKLFDIYDVEFDRNLVAHIITERCINCGRCVIACSDGAFQAIQPSENHPIVDETKCDGCGLCRQVCPVDGITMTCQ